ncbi:MAG TPA: hypothetical protein VD813_05725 [Pseudonocardia sp.]|nr:hypothetical protein [Pseudonocardia sp.]
MTTALEPVTVLGLGRMGSALAQAAAGAPAFGQVVGNSTSSTPEAARDTAEQEPIRGVAA